MWLAIQTKSMRTPQLKSFLSVLSLGVGGFLLPNFACADALDNWTSRIIATNAGGGFRDVAYGNGRYVAVGDSPATPDLGIVATSENGDAWTVRPNSLYELLAVTYATNEFVAVGYLGSIYSSADGITWVPRVQAPIYNFTAITYGKGRFVAVGDNELITGGTTTSNVYVSLDGTNWTAQNFGYSDALGAIAFNGSVFVAAGYNDIYRSTSGTSWTAAGVGSLNWRGLTFCNGLFIMPTGIGTNMVSADGAIWTVQTNDSPVAFNKVVYGHGIYLAFGSSDTFLTSTNGKNWVARQFPGTWNNFYVGGVALGAPKAVAVAFTWNGTTFYSVESTSDPLVALNAGTTAGQLTISGITGASYRIESVDALGPATTAWRTLSNFNLPTSPYHWTDVTARAVGSRFYRAVLLP
jgi:hypothetical protein